MMLGIIKSFFVFCAVCSSGESQLTTSSPNPANVSVAVPVNTVSARSPATSASGSASLLTTATNLTTANTSVPPPGSAAPSSNSSLDIFRQLPAQFTAANSSSAMSSSSRSVSNNQQVALSSTTLMTPTATVASLTTKAFPSSAPPTKSTSRSSLMESSQGTTPNSQSQRQGRADVVQGSSPGPQAQGSNSGSSFTITDDNSPPPKQTRVVWDALKSLQLLDAFQTVNDMMATAVGGVDYPIYATIPETSFRCDQVKYAGFYADPEGSCQVFRRCDLSGNIWSFLCPNMTLFNQITLVCDWYWNVDCVKSSSFYDYSNSRLYHSTWRLFDDEPTEEQPAEPQRSQQPMEAQQRSQQPTDIDSSSIVE